MSTGLIFDGIAGSECVDSSGEVLRIRSADCSNWETASGINFNWDHASSEKGPETIVGRVIYLKKIYSVEDCDNDRQKKYWKEVQCPYIYVIGRLADGAGHPGAMAIAALMRDNAANGEPLVCRLSVEGQTLLQEGNELKESIIKAIALTCKPCNRTANTEIIEDPNAPAGFEKIHAKEKTKDLLDIEDAKKDEMFSPLHRLGASFEMVYNPIVEDSLVKSLEAGSYNAAPSSLTSGAALQREDLGNHKSRALAVATKYLSEKKTFDKAEFRSFAKHKLPECSEDFLTHFADAVEQVHIKRSQLQKKESNKETFTAKKPILAKKPQAKPQATPQIDEEDASPVKIQNGTIRGVPVQPVKMRGYQFDEDKGILHTPKGSFPLYNPDKGFQTVTHKAAKNPFYKGGVLHVAPGADLKTIPHNEANPGFRDIYNSQPIEDFHSGKVMPNWLRVHELTKAGKLPEEVVMHSAMFAMMSPNTPVRPHELMYSIDQDTILVTCSKIAKPIREFIPGDTITGIDEAGNRVSTKVLALHDHGTLEGFEVCFDDGFSITCSKNHKFLTNVGMRPLWNILEHRLEVFCEPAAQERWVAKSVWDNVSYGGKIQSPSEGLSSMQGALETETIRIENFMDQRTSRGSERDSFADGYGWESVEKGKPWNVGSRNQAVAGREQRGICQESGGLRYGDGSMAGAASCRVQGPSGGFGTPVRSIQDRQSGGVGGEYPQDGGGSKESQGRIGYFEGGSLVKVGGYSDLGRRTNLLRESHQKAGGFCISGPQDMGGSGWGVSFLPVDERTPRNPAGAAGVLSESRRYTKGRGVEAWRRDVDSSIDEMFQGEWASQAKTRVAPMAYSDAPLSDTGSLVRRKIVRVRPVGPRRMYDLEVAHPKHNFLLPNGVVTSNSHLADTFEDLGIDARDPDFKKAGKHWLGKDKPHNYPKTATDYFRNATDLHLGADSKEKGRKVGDIKSFMLGNNKFKNVAQYSQLHQTLLDIVKRHGVDSRGAANELMSLKAKQIQWKNQRQGVKNKAKAEGLKLGLGNHATDYLKQKEAEAKAAGLMGRNKNKPDRVPGEDDDDETPMRWDPRFLPEEGENIHPSIFYSPQRAQLADGDANKRKQWRQEAQDLGLKDDLAEHAERTAFDKVGQYKGTVVPGLAPKTGRFTFTMLGGGNTFVPDTHIVRHLFGMDTDKDSHSLAYLKSVLWNAKNSHVLEGMDRWYAKNHPAAQLMQQHPKWNSTFKDDPEQANFPAFWRHWCTIAQDEKNRGIGNGAARNEFSTHEPFWMGIDKFVNPVKKSEDQLEPHMIAKMLAMHSQYEKDYGEVPAQMMFFQHIIPHLIEAGQHREKHDDLSDFVKMAKLHSLEIELKKSVSDLKLASFSDPRIPSVHAVYRKINGNEHRAGRFMLVNNELHHLEDNYGILSHFLPEGPMNLKTVSTIHGMKMSPSLRIDVEQPPENDNADKGLSGIKLQPAAAISAGRPSVFHYQRAGMDRPHTLEVNQGKYTLDGSELSTPEVQTMIGNAKTGAATIRYKKDNTPVGQIVKMEEMFASLVKVEGAPHAQDLLQHIRDLEAKGLVNPGTSEGFSRHIYEDPLTGLGNAKAWHEFKSKNKPGVYTSLDGQDFSAINNAFGHSVGDDALRTYGKAMRDAMQESGNHGKIFRSGGDEGQIYHPSHEHAVHFARKLHEKLEALPPIQGVHKLSVAMGLGTNPEESDKALYAAKDQKYLPGQEHLPARERKRAFKIGQAPNMVHSLVSGHEGPVPLHDPTQHALHQTLTGPSVVSPSSS